MELARNLVGDRPARLAVAGLSWGPDGRREIISGVDFAVEPGEMLAVVGPNGAGKSSLLRCLYRYHRPHAGTVALDGSDIWSLQPRDVARRVATVLQEPASDFGLSVAEIVELGLTPHFEKLGTAHVYDCVVDALSLLGLMELAPRDFASLSGGEKQRVMIARALVQKPDLLILDEPTNRLAARPRPRLGPRRPRACPRQGPAGPARRAARHPDALDHPRHLRRRRGGRCTSGHRQTPLFLPSRSTQSTGEFLMRLVPIALLAAALSATAATASGFPVTVKSCNRDVTFDAAPVRAVSNDVNLTEMMLALGLTGSMAGYTGVSDWKTLDATLREGVGELPELSPDYPTKEVLLGADADFYFAGWNYGMKVGGEVTPDTLDAFGIKVYELTESCIHIMDKPKSSMDDMYNDILNLGRIFGVEEKAVALVGAYKAELADFTATLPRAGAPRVFVYDSGEDKPFTAGRYAIPTALIEAAGGSNIMDDVASSWVEIGWEPVIERDPDIVVIVNYGDVTAEQKADFMRSSPAFKDIAAVRNNRFVTLDYVEATPGPRNIAAIKRLAAAFHSTN
jgi:iron complex transport system substrate-binding protein